MAESSIDQNRLVYLQTRNTFELENLRGNLHANLVRTALEYSVVIDMIAARQEAEQPLTEKKTI